MNALDSTHDATLSTLQRTQASCLHVKFSVAPYSVIRSHYTTEAMGTRTDLNPETEAPSIPSRNLLSTDIIDGDELASLNQINQACWTSSRGDRHHEVSLVPRCHHIHLS